SRATTASDVSMAQLVAYFLRLGAIGFGGPAALVAIMEDDLVERRCWLNRDEYLEGLAICQTLPGPLAIQVGIYVGYVRRGAVVAVVTAWLQAEIALLFIVAGILGIVIYGRHRPPVVTAALIPVLAVTTESARVEGARVLERLLVFFLKAGSFTFGSGLVIVPFLREGVVSQQHWLTERDFMVAIAIGMISPGPVVITATFVGYVVGGVIGSVVATVGIFLPSFLLVTFAAPLLVRYRENAYVQGFVRSVSAAAVGAILGASVVLARLAI